METSQEGRDGLPGGPLYKFEKGEKTKLGNGQKGVKISTYFVKMSFRYICALTSHFVNFCEFELSVCSSNNTTQRHQPNSSSYNRSFRPDRCGYNRVMQPRDENLVKNSQTCSGKSQHS